MAFIAPLVARFTQSISPDVVSNRVRINDPGAFSYGPDYSEVPTPSVDGDGFSRIDLATLPVGAGLEGTFEVNITAVDERGNESDPLVLPDVLFDFAPPAPPTDGAIE